MCLSENVIREKHEHELSRSEALTVLANHLKEVIFIVVMMLERQE